MKFMNATQIIENLTNVTRPFYSKIIVTVIILLLGLFIGRFIGKLITKILGEIELNKIYKLATGLSARLDKIIGINHNRYSLSYKGFRSKHLCWNVYASKRDD